MSGNEHISNALDWQHGEAEPSAFALQNAQIEATLALAYEQRTANLIAMLQPIQCADGVVIHSKAQFAVTAIGTIQERLGVSQDGTVTK